MTITAADLVNREVGHCVSALISTLAYGFPSDFDGIRTRDYSGLELVEQARELANPIDDWEEAAREAGWRFDPLQEVWTKDGDDYLAVDAEDACERAGVEPCDREVFEHWIVSDWLADKLIEKGEKVDKDFAGLCVWARTTTGQAISIDSVIEEIHADLVRS